MDMLTKMALGKNVNTLVYSVDDAFNLHQWVCALEDDDEAISAVRQDVLNNGLVFIMGRGATFYKEWMKKQITLVKRFAVTKFTGGDEWWWEALDRLDGLLLLEQGEIEAVNFRGTYVPVPAPVGFDYSDLLRGQLEAMGWMPMRPRHPGCRASGGRPLASGDEA